MTVDEMLTREAIRDTLARCSLAGDRGQWDDYADCFAEEGVIQSEREDGEIALRFAGREAIRAWQKAWKSRAPGDGDRPRASFVQPSFIQHCLTTSQIDLTAPDRATVQTYWVVVTDVGADHAGYYLDEFERAGDRWLIAWRRVRKRWNAEDSAFAARQ